MGEKIADKPISISDDFYHPLNRAPLRWEGKPRQRVLMWIVAFQRLCLFTRGRQSAQKKQPQGTVLRFRNEYGEEPMNLVFGGGDLDRENGRFH